ncbi:MAG TPA: helix-turn-helix transcriptional regulator [bacterium]|nr:helix-turn-helix transcriptional regulator [bacterium]
MLGMPDDVVRKVGRRIRELRQKKGWSQEKLAEEAGLHRTYIGQVERGEKNIGVENLFRIAKAFDVEPAYMLRGLSL